MRCIRHDLSTELFSKSLETFTKQLLFCLVNLEKAGWKINYGKNNQGKIYESECNQEGK